MCRLLKFSACLLLFTFNMIIIERIKFNRLDIILMNKVYCIIIQQIRLWITP